MKSILAFIAAIGLALTASARTVYDAGKALRQNCESGSYANPYTDANGGVWSYHTASGVAPFTGLGDFPAHSQMESGTMDGWICLSGENPTHPLLLVNMTGEAVSSYCSSGNQLDADEMMLHPSRTGYAVLRFTVPQDGWYSALASFRDVDQETNPSATSGVDVHVFLDDTDLATTHVTLEDFAEWNAKSKRTQRFDYQMPVRYLTQGTKIQFAVGPNVSNGHISDGTGVKVLVVKEDEGRFYDSGIAFTTNVVGGYVNPYGTAQHGTWHALLLNLGASAAATDFQSWIPQNLENSFDHAFTETFPVGDGRQGFKTANGYSQPFVLVNPTDSKIENLSPRELSIHPPHHNNNQCTVVRFRPPEAGRYSASVVARYLENDVTDGVEVFLVVADQIITNSVVSGDHVKSTMHLTFDNILLAAAEPVDIIVSPRSTYNSDSTGISAIFRREDGAVYDANKSFYARHIVGDTSVPFDDVLGGGAQWSVGSMGGSWLPESFATFAGYLTRTDNVPPELFWWEHAYNNGGTLPRIAMETNSIASKGKDIYLTRYDRLAITPNEFCAHPAVPNQNTSCVAVRAIVPSNGIYRVRGRARDLDNTTPNYGGVRFTLALGGCISATSLVRMNYPPEVPYEVSLESDRLWMKAGETFDAVIDPDGQNYEDSTGLGLCYEREGDGTASVVNVDFTGTGTGKLSANTARGREGFGNQHVWNALRPGGEVSASVEGCRDADGTTTRTMSVSLTRTSGVAIATGSAATGTTLLDSFVTSSDADDTYTFTISNLKKNEPYTLYLYSANGRSAGNAAFTVGDVTKGVEGIWLLGGKMVSRFDVMSDENGEISGTFAAADGNGGAFNGLTLVGDVRKHSGMMIILR